MANVEEEVIPQPARLSWRERHRHGCSITGKQQPFRWADSKVGSAVDLKGQWQLVGGVAKHKLLLLSAT